MRLRVTMLRAAALLLSAISLHAGAAPVFAEEARAISNELELPIYATEGTAEMLRGIGVACTSVGKGEEGEKSAVSAIDAGDIDLVINVPLKYDRLGRPDGYLIRRRAIDAGIPLVTDRELARAVIDALRWRNGRSLGLVARDEYLTQATSRT